MKSWPIIAGAAILAVGGAVAFGSTRPETYRSSASLIFGEAAYQQVVAGGYNPVDAQRRLRTSAELIQLPVVKSRTFALLRSRQGIRLADARVTPTYSKDSNTMQIIATAADGRSAAALANATAQAFLDYRSDLSDRALVSARALLKKQIKEAPGKPERRGLVAKRNNLEALRALDDQQIQVAQPALAPASATKRDGVRTWLIALVLGLVVGIAISLLRIREPEPLVDPWADSTD